MAIKNARQSNRRHSRKPTALVSTSDMSPAPSPAPAPSTSKILVPDLVSHCEFKLRLNPNVHEAATASEKWMIEGGKVSAQKAADFKGLKAGLLTSMCYPDAPLDELRVCCDFMYYLFHLWVTLSLNLMRRSI
jgi:hypothetical protein